MATGRSRKGRLKDIDDHLQQCRPYQILSCTNGCGKNIEQKQLRHHLESNCPKRLIKCRYCNEEENTFQFITRRHLKVCPQYPIQCINIGCSKKVPCSQMTIHKESCPKEIIFCEYSTIGCIKRMKREEQEEHNEQSMDEHLQMAVKEIADVKETSDREIADLKRAKETSDREIADLKRAKETSDKEIADLKRGKATSNKEIADLKRGKATSDREIADLKRSKVQLETKIAFLEEGRHNQSYQHIQFNEFSKRKSNSEQWCSPGFYTSPGGYKMSLYVYANAFGEDTHISCFICLMSGEYDDILEWPFQGKVTVELLNQLEDKNHYKYTIGFNESTPQQCKQKVVGELYSGSGWGCRCFISHSQLGYNSSLNCQYLKDDTLYFRVSVKVTSTTKPWLVGHSHN